MNGYNWSDGNFLESGRNNAGGRANAANHQINLRHAMPDLYDFHIGLSQSSPLSNLLFTGLPTAAQNTQCNLTPV